MAVANIRAGEVPKLIKQTAEEFAGVFYDQGRSDRFRKVGLSQKAYIRRYWANFVPPAIETLSALLGMPGTPEDQKHEIYDAILIFKALSSETTPKLSKRRLH